MKKFLSILIVLALLVAFVLPARLAMAEVDLTADVYTIANETASTTSTLIPITIIIPGKCRISRYIVSNNYTSVNTSFASLHDASSTAAATNKACEGELKLAASSTVQRKYLRPLKISNGCVITQGAYTTVTVEWDRVTP